MDPFWTLAHFAVKCLNRFSIAVDQRTKTVDVASDILRAGADVVLNGMVCGNVQVDGGKLVLNGMVNGDVVNRSGEIEFCGRINGQLRRPGGITHISPGAIAAG